MSLAAISFFETFIKKNNSDFKIASRNTLPSKPHFLTEFAEV